MHDTTITLQGWLGSDVTLRRAGDTPVANFRVACTPRHRQRSSGEWTDGETQWYTVNAWRGLAENTARSLRRGDAVVVHGRLVARCWTTQAGDPVTSFEVEATVVGHDLNRGTTTFTKPHRAGDAEAASDAGGAQADAPAA